MNMEVSPEFVIFPDLSFASIPKPKLDIFNALRRLVTKKDFDRISVREICDLAQVSKSTFYSYFADKNAIMRWHYDLVSDAGITEIGRTLSWEEGHLITTAGFASEHPLYFSAGKSQDYMNNILEYGNKKRQTDLIVTLEKYRHIKPTSSLRVQIAALAAAEQAVIKQFPVGPNLKDICEFVDNMIRIVPKDLYEAVQIENARDDFDIKNPWNKLHSDRS